MFNIDQMNMPWIHSPFFERQLAAETTLSDHEKEAIHFFAKNGYLIFDPEIPAELIDRAIKETAEYEGPEKMWDGRIQQGWLSSKAIREVAVARKVHDLLRVIYRREPIPFQTLNFTRGTEQDTHSDTIHFQSYPANFMCGVWVAFEDIGAQNGPLHYYVGSHKLPLYDLFDTGTEVDNGDYSNYTVYLEFVRELMATAGLERKELELAKGQALIWAANLFHGGSPILDRNSTRYSQVTHYFFENCAYYTPMRSSMATQICWRRRGLQDVRTGKAIRHFYLGNPFQPPWYSGSRSWSLAHGVRKARGALTPHGGRLKRILGLGTKSGSWK
jgi:Phytanoyl-CoA dioxygenase (PhyH)